MIGSPEQPTTTRRGRAILEGVLVPVSWSESGQVTAIGLNTSDEREFRLRGSDRVMSQLMGCLRQRVGLTGELVGGRAIRVQQFEVLEPTE